MDDVRDELDEALAGTLEGGRPDAVSVNWAIYLALRALREIIHLLDARKA